MPVLEARGLTVSWEGMGVLDDVSLSVGAGQLVCLVGRSGSGKSTLFHALAGLSMPDAGTVLLEGEDVTGHPGSVAYMLQKDLLLPEQRVVDNVALPLRLAGVPKREARDRARQRFAEFGLAGTERLYPSQLSGGMRQRAALLRTCMMDNDVVLLDEPFSALDGHLRWTLEMALADTLRGFPGGTVYVSHDRDEVYRLCDQVCAVDRGVSDPAVPTKRFFEEPGTRAAAVISGCKNISAARATGSHEVACDDWGVTLACAGEAGPATDYVGLRAHYFSVEGSENPIPCTVDRVIDSTFSTIVMLSTRGPGKIRYELDKDAWAALGDPDRITLHIAPEHVMPLADRRVRSQGGAHA